MVEKAPEAIVEVQTLSTNTNSGSLKAMGRPNPPVRAKQKQLKGLLEAAYTHHRATVSKHKPDF